MTLDIKTIVLFNTIITTFIALSLVFYRAHQKTYSGFGYWISGTLCVALGYQLMILRGIMPYWLNIFFANLTFTLAAVLKWEGITLFLKNRHLNRLVYGLPLLVVSINLMVFGSYEGLQARALVFAVAVLTVCLLAFWDIWTAGVSTNNAIFKATGLVLLAYGSMTIIRSVFWFIFPSTSFFNAGLFHSGYYILVTLLELAAGIAFLMLNSQRLEKDLHASHSELKESIANLSNALSEIKTLSGMLPICASCKKIRDDRGYWNRIETYIESHSDAQFSHGICPECAENLYRDTPWYKKKNKPKTE